MNIVAIIPERMSSTRFPGKPMKEICGIPMVAHIYERTKLAKSIDGVYVATPDREILEYIKANGGKGGLEYTSPRNAPTTIKEAFPEIEQDFGKNIDWIIMVQGDEPLITPELIDSLADHIRNKSSAKAINVIASINRDEEYFDPNIVKIVLNQKGEGMWFFRVPSERWREEIRNLPIKKQTGIIAFKKEYLMTFGTKEKSPLEKIESVDMFNLIENGENLQVILTEDNLYSVDTDEDRIEVEKIMEKDPHLKIYEKKYTSKN